jgi:hypothetical protein
LIWMENLEEAVTRDYSSMIVTSMVDNVVAALLGAIRI